MVSLVSAAGSSNRLLCPAPAVQSLVGRIDTSPRELFKNRDPLALPQTSEAESLGYEHRNLLFFLKLPLVVLVPLVGRPALKGLSAQTLYVMQMISVLKLSFVSFELPAADCCICISGRLALLLLYNV